MNANPLLEDESEAYTIRKLGAMLRFYFNIDYTELKDNEFADRIQELHYMLNFEGKRVTTHGKLNLPQL